MAGTAAEVVEHFAALQNACRGSNGDVPYTIRRAIGVPGLVQYSHGDEDTVAFINTEINGAVKAPRREEESVAQRRWRLMKNNGKIER